MPVTEDNTEHTTEINTQAVTWLVRLTSGDITSDELAALRAGGRPTAVMKRRWPKHVFCG
ncbi:hypothetical protein LNO88_28840 [Klebsiella pneumoniae subsp. pneumoniae]|nr:hypothetical protein [Klebsiella pneumoniae subsp. pneumoniae]